MVNWLSLSSRWHDAARHGSIAVDGLYGQSGDDSVLALSCGDAWKEFHTTRRWGVLALYGQVNHALENRHARTLSAEWISPTTGLKFMPPMRHAHGLDYPKFPVGL